MTLRIGIVGLGAIARSTHMPVLSSFGDVILEAAADINLTKSKEKFASSYNIKKLYVNYEDMFDASKLDCVFVCVPPILHYKVTKSALNHGMNVFCEKPMGISSDEAVELVRIAQKEDLIVGVGYGLRFVKNYIRTAEVVSSLVLGKILQVHGSFMRPGPYIGWNPDGTWHLDEVGGGILYDLLSHLIDLITYILSDRIVTISSKYISTMNINIPDNVVGAFQTVNGTLGTVNVGWRISTSYDSFQIHGTAGGISVNPLEFEQMSASSDMLDRVMNHGRSAIHIFRKGISIMLSRNQYDVFYQQDREFIDSIGTKTVRHNYATGEDAIHTLKAIEGFRESAITGKTISIQ